MVVISRAPGTAGLGDYQLDPPYSATAVYPSNQATIRRAQAASGNWANAQRPGVRGTGLNRYRYRGMSGLGAITDSIPEPVIWGGGAAVAGLVLGYLLFRK